MAKIIATDKAPSAIGPYSQAVTVGNMVFTSGQIAIDPAVGDIAAKDIASQTEQVMKNLEAVLNAAGTSLQNAVKTTCFLADMEDFAVFNRVYAAHVPSNPARSCVAVKTLPRGVRVEEEVLACIE